MDYSSLGRCDRPLRRPSDRLKRQTVQMPEAHGFARPVHQRHFVAVATDPLRIGVDIDDVDEPDGAPLMMDEGAGGEAGPTAEPTPKADLTPTTAPAQKAKRTSATPAAM